MERNALHLRVDVHDRSRIEWVATVPMAPPGQAHTYEILFEADVPDAMWVPHHPWDRFQVRSRLTSPVLVPGHRLEGVPIEQLRRRALAAAHELKQAMQRPLRMVAVARRRDGKLRPEEAETLVLRLHAILATAAAAREAFDYLRDADDAALEREQTLAAEYVSAHILMLITRIADAIQVRRTGRPRPALGGDVAVVEAALRTALQAEEAARATAGLRPAPRTPEELEPFVNRAALLKKHFQQALFLDATAYMLDQRLRNWVAIVVAMIASVFYFLSMRYMLVGGTSAEQTTFSLFTAIVLGSLVYAAKDRIKEVGKDWLANRLKHGYGDRVVHLRLQQRMDQKRSQFAIARETIAIAPQWHDDPLNPGLGKTALMHHLRVRELLRHEGSGALQAQGMTGLKHVFRYDLSPLFVKLDDHLKRVPVTTTHGVRTLASARSYTIPIRVQLQRVGHGVLLETRGVLRLRRGGLVRFEREAVSVQRTADATLPRLVGAPHAPRGLS